MKVCIYHGGCTDGVAAAWVVWRYDKEFVFHPGVYNQEPPWELIDKAESLLLVDFSYRLSIMEEIVRRAPGMVTVLDHHASAQEQLGDFVGTRCAGVINMDHCGALLAWVWFFSHEKAPRLLVEIDKQDRWLEDRDADLIRALRSYPHAPIGKSWILRGVWDEFMGTWDKLMNTQNLSCLKDDGAVISRYYNQRLEDLKKLQTWFWFDGLDRPVCLPAVNAPYAFASDLAGWLSETYYGTVGLCWYVGADGNAHFSARSRGNCSPNARLVAEFFGGGGHDNAAGFRIPMDEAAKLLYVENEDE